MDLDEREACGIHDGDKLGNAVTFKLICFKNKRVVNLSPSRVALMNPVMKAETHFSYGTRINNLHNVFEMTYYPNIKTYVNKNGIRVAAHHRLL